MEEADDWKLLLGVPQDIEADIIAGLLEAEGIAVRKVYPEIGEFMHIAAGVTFWTELWVPASKWEEAGAIVGSKLIGEGDQGEDPTENRREDQKEEKGEINEED